MSASDANGSRIPSIQNTSDAAKGAVAGLTGGVVAGLERAQQAAGDVLRSIFGGLPWEMAADAITNAVSGGSAGFIAYVPEVAVYA